MPDLTTSTEKMKSFKNECSPRIDCRANRLVPRGSAGTEASELNTTGRFSDEIYRNNVLGTIELYNRNYTFLLQHCSSLILFVSF